jgi:hypothetical protein
MGDARGVLRADRSVPVTGLPPNAIDGTVVLDDPSVLTAICRPGVVLAVWQRSEPGFRARLETFPFGQLPSARFEVDPRETGARLMGLFDGVPEDEACLAALAQDVEVLATRFAAALETRWVRVRLDPVDRDMCRYFHCDNVEARLITTYVGATTQFLAPADADPSGLGSGDNDRIVRSWDKVRSLPRNSVGLFKGSRYPQAGNGCVHRSPPATRMGGERLLLCIDPVRDLYGRGPPISPASAGR